MKKAGNGVYAFVIAGQAEMAGQVLTERDGLGVWDTGSLVIKASAESNILLMDVPMRMV